MSDIFEKASRLKLRFCLPGKVVSVEDLWDIDPMILDVHAGSLHEALKSHERFSILRPKKEDTANRLRLDIVTYVIETRMKEEQDRETALLKQQEDQKLLEILESRKDQRLEKLSDEEILARLGR